MTAHHGPRRPRLDALIDQRASFEALDDRAARERAAALEELAALHAFGPFPEDPLGVLAPVLARLRHTTGDPEATVAAGPGWHRLVAEVDSRLAAVDSDYDVDQIAGRSVPCASTPTPVRPRTARSSTRCWGPPRPPRCGCAKCAAAPVRYAGASVDASGPSATCTSTGHDI